MSEIEIDVEGGYHVSGLLQMPPGARACCILAHGAGAGMHHAAMAALADGLVARQVAVLRYQFPYMEAGSKRPDRPALAHATVRAAAEAARRYAPGLPLVAGGKSFGGRMTSQAQALCPLPDVRGLVFFAFPLHPAGKPSIERAAHLAEVAIPMLFVQGTQDALAEIALLEPVLDGLGARATTIRLDDADHAFHLPRRTGRRDAEVLAVALDETAAWIGRLCSG